MEPLPVAFTSRQYAYQQLERTGNIAIFEQRHTEGDVKRYEVVRIRVQSETHWPNGTVTPEREAYPGPSSWGKLAWTCFTLQEAQALTQSLLARQDREELDGDPEDEETGS